MCWWPATRRARRRRRGRVLTVTASKPVFVLQPASQLALQGNSVQLTAAAEGNDPLACRWRLNGTNLADGNGLSGSATGALVISNAEAANIGTYSVVASNALGTVASSNAVLSVYAQADMQLLQNGGFETGDFSFWNPSGNDVLDTISEDATFVHSGLYGASMGASGSLGFISQTAATTPGGIYLLSFWLDSPDGVTPNELFVGWNGYMVSDQTNLPATGWVNYQFTVTATASNTTVQIGCRDDNSYLGLDDISLKPLFSPGGAPVITNQPPRANLRDGGPDCFHHCRSGRARRTLSYHWASNHTALGWATNATLLLSNITTASAATYAVVVSNSLGVMASSNSILTVGGRHRRIAHF